MVSVKEVMEPLSGLGRARSMIQLVSMLEGIVSQGRENFNTSNINDGPSIAIISMLQKLSSMCDVLRHRSHEHPELRSAGDDPIADIAGRCDSICHGLQVALASLHDERGGQQVSRATKMSVWKGGNNNDMEESLLRLRLQLSGFLDPNIRLNHLSILDHHPLTGLERPQHDNIGVPLSPLNTTSCRLEIDVVGSLPQPLQVEQTDNQKISTTKHARELYQRSTSTHTPCPCSFTEDDTRQYIQRTLEEISWFKVRKGSNPSGYTEVVEYILQISNRSFAWIDLAISNVLDRMNHLNRIYDFLTKLRLVPADLDTLFLKILDGMSAKHKEQAYILLIASQSDKPLNVLAYSFLDKLTEIPEYVLEAMAIPMLPELADQRCESMKKQIIRTCKSLLDITLNDQGEECVTFSRQSIHDFIRTNQGRGILLSRLNGTFDAGREVCSVLLAQIKFHKIGPVWDTEGSVHRLVSQFLREARKYEVSTGQTLGDHINELEITVQKRKGPTFWWWQTRSVAKGEVTVTFLELIMEHRLSVYLKWRFETCPNLAPSRLAMANLLESALIPVSNSQLDSDIVRVFLNHGANPNYPSDHGHHVDSRPTPWRLFLLHLHQSAWKRDTVNLQSNQQLSFALEYLIRAGADLGCLIRPVTKGELSGTKPTANVADIIRTCVSPGDATSLLQVIEERKLQGLSRLGWLTCK